MKIKFRAYFWTPSGVLEGVPVENPYQVPGAAYILALSPSGKFLYQVR